ncbi:hypothetical protein [Terriglobus aquaticus]|uniref:Oligosaccharide repeat unit polymerase n=1 Tax=Terriglobus aquaticus TaxID=940139 RepID=A0ABW9KGP2_9BACT|nr:hypothetical protein [Terriglobus aquaticus]
MFELLLCCTAVVLVLGMAVAYDGSRDILHPMFLLAPMMGVLYAWMPFKLLSSGGLDAFFDRDQLVHVQTLYLLGTVACICGCLLAGTRARPADPASAPIPTRMQKRLLISSGVLGTVGLSCWMVTIINVGGFRNAFSAAYSGGWDDNGYVRDGAMLLLIGVSLAVMARASGAPRLPSFLLIAGFALPWLASALLMGRRGPTFGLAVIALLSWYLPRGTRPPILASAAIAGTLAFFVLLLVTNRQNIYLGSDREMTSDVSDILEKPQSGNEYIYGSGAVLSAEQRDHYFWMRRYLAQIFVRPVPTSIWPNKYADFGVPELLYNAGTGEGFGDALGWNGAPGSAPGIIADLWLEVWWLAVPLFGLIGWCYGAVWHKSITEQGPWMGFYTALAALSIYLVMQTMEAVIFRTLELVIPSWLAWRWAAREDRSAGEPAPGTRSRLAAIRHEEVQHA